MRSGRFIKLGAVCVSTVLSSTSPLLAGTHTTSLAISSLMFADEATRWQGYTFIGQDVVGSLNSASSRGALALDGLLGLDQSTPAMRTLFLLTAGQAQTRFVWANSILAHEYAHFQHAHGFGLTEHFFQDDDTQEEFSWDEAWLRIFLKGQVGGPATSGEGREGRDQAYLDEEGIRRSLSGLNWQMTYSEERLRSWLAGEERTVFDAADFLLNRGYTLSYALGSAFDLHDGNSEKGDPAKFAAHLEQEHGASDVLAKMAGISLVADLLSPGFLGMAASFGPYISDGSKAVEPAGHALGAGGWITWDIPQYLNDDNFSIVPTIYWRPSDAQVSSLGAESLMLGLGVEASILGAQHQELRATVDGTWQSFELGAGASLSFEGQYLDVKAAYALSDGLHLAAGGAARFGETLKADRDLPDTDTLAWFGLEYRF